MGNMREVVITGMGVISPIGLRKEEFWESLCEGRSGVRALPELQRRDVPCAIGGIVGDFQPKKFVKPRKNIKVMSRDIQMGYVAADLAYSDAAVAEGAFDPARVGVLFGADMIGIDLGELAEVYRNSQVEGKFDFNHWGRQAMADMFPLWMLKYLPNMPACHIGIGHDARGPNDSLTLREVSSLSALAEAVRVIERGQADAAIAGGTSSRLQPTILARRHAYELSDRVDDPAAASRPFDAQRDGMVHGEGAAAFVLEERSLAQARGARILARILGFAATFEPNGSGRPLSGDAIRRSIRGALAAADLQPGDIGHVNAEGQATRVGDRIEAAAIHDTLGDTPVTAPKSFFGNLAGGAGAVEMVASLLALEKGLVPPTLNYEHPDPECPINVVHGRPQPAAQGVAMVLNHDTSGRAIAMIVAG